MMRSLYSGVSGLRVHQTKMDVIANNISNVNTIGFKSSRATFQEVFNQTLNGASKASQKRGGINPTQIGLGVTMGSIDLNMNSGIPQRTDSPFDLMIDGEGFFIMSDSGGTYFTRAGAFRKDEDGNITDLGGRFVQGWNSVEFDSASGEYVVKATDLRNVQITPDKEYMDPTSTSYVRATGNLNAIEEPVRTASLTLYDSLGNRYSLDVSYEYDSDPTSTTYKQWAVMLGPKVIINGDTNHAVYIDPATVTTAGADVFAQRTYAAGTPNPYDTNYTGNNPYTTTATQGATNANGGSIFSGLVLTDAVPAIPTSITLGHVFFNTDGKLYNDANAGTTPPNVPGWTNASPTSFIFSIQVPASTQGNPAGTTNVLDPNAAFGSNGKTTTIPVGEIVWNFSNLTQQNGAGTAKNETRDGNNRGILSRTSVGADGTITGVYTNGENRVMAQIAITTFRNPAGLEKVGNNLFVATRNSGDFDGKGSGVYDIGSKMMGGVLEMSNVDLATEFVEMITTQRGFQANSRSITTSDEMLQELVNLKR